jgi:type III secretion protein V
MGEEMTSQLTTNPKSMYMAAALLCGFAAVPGFPWYVFVFFSVVLVAAARILVRNNKKEQLSAAGVLKSLQREGARGEATGFEEKAAPFSAPLATRLSIDLGVSLDKQALNAAFDVERTSLQEKLGLPFPGMRVWTGADQASESYEIMIHDVPTGSGNLPANLRLVTEAPEGWLAGRSSAHAAHSPGDETASHWIAKSDVDAIQGLRSLSHEQVLARHAGELLRSHAHLFLGIQEVHWILERMTADYPGLVGEVQKVLPLQRIAEVLRRLLEEHISIRNMRAISESLIVWGPKEKDMLMLTEYVRGDLGRYLAHRATNGTGTLSAVLLDPALEKAIRECIKPTPAGNFLAMPSEQTIAIAERIAEVAGETARPALAVVASVDIRRYVRRMVEVRLKWLPVYSYQELGEHARIEPLGRVSA